MNEVVQLPNRGHRVDVRRGEVISAVSSQWWNRPDDQRFTSLSDLRESVYARSTSGFADVIETNKIEVRSNREDGQHLGLVLPHGGDAVEVKPTHWSFGQICSEVGAPAGYLRSLPGPIAAIPLQYGLINHRREMVKAFVTDTGEAELRAVTSPTYGRIYDYEVADAVMKIAGDGTGDTHWKVPGLLDPSMTRYNPYVDVTKETTTLYASDRDVFLFLVDDTRPIEAGKLPDGSPDLMFRGFYVWNSEVGSKSFGLATMLLRGVCMNRNLWGVEDFSEMVIRHSKNAPDRFVAEARPKLEDFSLSSEEPVMAKIRAARGAKVAETDEEATEFLTKRGFSKKTAEAIKQTVLQEEERRPESVWDFVQGIAAHARKLHHQDERVAMERIAGRMMDRVA